MHPSAYRDAERFVRSYLPDAPLAAADIGSLDINGSLRPLFDNPKWRYTGYDIVAGKNVDVVLKAWYSWDNIPRGSVDIVVSTQVIEHVREPWLWIEEIADIVRRGGLLYLCSPNTHPYHEHPVDCWRIWPDGMRALLEWAGLEILECYCTQPTAENNGIGDTTGIARKRHHL